MVKKWLVNSHPVVFSLYCLIAAFGVYFCMYAYRKPFTAASFEHKELLVIAQVIGYFLSKLYGIRAIAELKGDKRAYLIVFLILFSQSMLLIFGYAPDTWRRMDWIWLFLNGIPLGMIWGVVFSYLEGRKFTEIFSAGLTVSFIISSGFVKSVGKALISDFGIDPYVMPSLTGFLFFPFLLLFVWMLSQIPPPTGEDRQLRAVRSPMTMQERTDFFQTFVPGIVLLVVSYMMFTAIRDIRETFANEIWARLEITDPAIFTQTELPVGLVIGLVLAFCFKIKDNILAFRFYHYLMLLGLALVGIFTLAFTNGLIDPVTWMVVLGIGTYLAYVTFSSVLFDRLIGAFRHKANAGFMIYIVDSMGYLGSVLIMIYKMFGRPEMNWLSFFISTSLWVAVTGMVLITSSLVYFNTQYQKRLGQFRLELQAG